jgi:phosphatidylglycerol---prolipoprotein diacylglyceryl transferase
VIVALDPVVLSIGPLAVRWFGLLALVGLGLAVWLSLRELRQQALLGAANAALDALAWSLPTGLVAARLVHVLGWSDFYLTRPWELWQWSIDGLSLWGGLLAGGAMAAARLGRRLSARERRRIFDVLAPSVALAIAIGRLGEFLDGHGQGLPASVLWATQYSSPLAATPDFGVPRHPAQVYDALIALGVFLLLRRLPTRLPAGSRLAALLVLYGSARVLLGAVRLDPAFLFGLQLEQLLALGGLAFGLIYGVRPLLQPRHAAAATKAGHATLAREDTVAA